MKIPLLSMLLALTPVAAAGAGAPKPSVGQLTWLTGCWGFSGKTSDYQEVWLAPTADSLHGLSRRVGQDGATREFEFLRVVTDEQGLAYLAQPNGAAPVRFTLQSLDGTHAVFANPQHDFPQTISYQFTPPDQLLARIEGPRAGKSAAVDFPMTRQPCEAKP
jgi:hypothetical protein